MSNKTAVIPYGIELFLSSGVVHVFSSLGGVVHVLSKSIVVLVVQFFFSFCHPLKKGLNAL